MPHNQAKEFLQLRGAEAYGDGSCKGRAQKLNLNMGLELNSNCQNVN